VAEKLTNEQIKARIIMTVAVGLTVAFVMSIGALLYGLLFVVQPIEQAPNDAEAWAVLSQKTLKRSKQHGVPCQNPTQTRHSQL
jgi:hypothetical protein